MNGRRVLMGILVLGLLLLTTVGFTQAQGAGPTAVLGTAFTYQGRLNDGGSPANGLYDFQFRLYSDEGSQVGSTITVGDRQVTDGLFTVELDFGSGMFTGLGRWLEIAIRPGASSGAYTTLTPRVHLTAAPYALALPGLWTQPNATSPNVIGGYAGNSVTAGVVGATISGGGASGSTNSVTDNYGTVGGGHSNRAGDNAGTLSDAAAATVCGGAMNQANGAGSAVGGGTVNVVNGDYTTIGGGLLNAASGDYAAIGGGYSHLAGGDYATIPGGHDNRADGDYSFAAGHRASALATGCFVWGDSSDTLISCNTINRWVARASGGVYFYTMADISAGSYLAGGGSAWNAVSERSRKENFRPVDSQELLRRLAAIEISTWNYRSQDPSIRHIGPMADDFNGLVDGLGGEGENMINSLDADGVALAAIQGLYERSLEMEAENAELRQQVDDLEARVAALEAASGRSPLQAGLLPGALLLAGMGLFLGLSRRRVP